MPDAPIGVFDSGIGGTTVLQAVRELLPNENFVFFGDSKNCPFGTKELPELKEIVKDAAEFLIEKHVKLIIVACNTATTQTIDYLRETFPDIPFVGTEPAIKLACDSDASNILLLSTEGTAHSPRTQELIEQNIKPDQRIDNFPCLGLAEAIETRDINKIRANLADNFKNIPEPEKIDAVVLGCTHYPLASAEIQKFFPNAKLMDGGEGVAKQVKTILEEKGILNTNDKRGEVEYFFSKAEE
ncbi:glutamate racemase [Candidatus Saccharibacteria bacterium]|nr:glutamate racemase [Candidatus Saccharibacteria bacterium]